MEKKDYNTVADVVVSLISECARLFPSAHRITAENGTLGMIAVKDRVLAQDYEL